MPQLNYPDWNNILTNIGFFFFLLLHTFSLLYVVYSFSLAFCSQFKCCGATLAYIIFLVVSNEHGQVLAVPRGNRSCPQKCEMPEGRPINTRSGLRFQYKSDFTLFFVSSFIFRFFRQREVSQIVVKSDRNCFRRIFMSHISSCIVHRMYSWLECVIA